MDGQDQRMCSRSPLSVLHLQHVSEAESVNNAIFVGVRYHRSDIFCVSSQNAVLSGFVNGA